MDRLWCALLALLCLAGACSSGVDDDGDRTAKSGDSDSANSADGRPPAELAMVDHGPEGILRLALQRPDSFAPADVVLTDQSAVIVADLLYDGLTEAAADRGSLRPALAERWEPNENFTTWTFHLAAQAIERDITADLIVAALTPMADGASPARRGGAAAVVAAGLRTISAVDDRTVLIELSASNAGLPWVLSGLPFSVVGADGLATGRYDVVSDDANGMILKSRGTSAEGADGGDDSSQAGVGAGDGGRPAEIRITWFDDADGAYEALEQGIVEAAVVDPVRRSMAADPTSLPLEQTVATRFYVMNARSPTLADRSARRAVLSAIDRELLLDAGFNQQGSDVSVASVDGLLAESIVGFDDDARCSAICAFDPTAAGQFTAEVGSPRIQLAYAGGDQSTAADAIVDQLTAAGFAAEATQLPPDELARVIVTGETDLFGFGWVAPATSSDAVIPPLLTVDSPANIARVDSPAVAELLAEAAMTADDQHRWSLLNAAHRAAMDQALIIPVATSISMLVRGPDAGWLRVRADGSIDVETPAISGESGEG